MAGSPAVTDAFGALSDQGRRDILAVIGTGERTVSDLVESLAMAQPQVSKHLGVLRQSGLVSVRPAGKWRYYRVAGQGIKQVHDWAAGFAATWNDRLDRLDVLVSTFEEERS